MRAACFSRMSTHLLKSLQGLEQIWTEVWITYSGSNLFPRASPLTKTSNKTVASSWRYVGSLSMTPGKTGSADPHRFPTAAEHCRTMALLSRKHRQDYEYTAQGKPERGWRSWRLCFSMCTGNRQSKVSAPHTAGCQLYFLAKINKRLSGFSFCYQSNTRHTTSWSQTVLDMNIFCFWCILLKSCWIFFS